ncbi:lipopolysaccharide biosynthesis protein [Shewanella algae]|uniref:lipopolysaccharide biosynthesis protein n=1 Tax=Shewanella algae TaxID=38313 RepID=UPI001AAE0852|nr:lipopolysaccharide biosynthesis protein [Shewanella algae]MBO2600167.1 lipopolysaccharide biosynthesis protein [Shewanella algae]
MRTSIIKDFSIVSLGTIVAKLAYFLVLPFLSRSFTPEDFTLLSSFLSLATIISVAMCFRYDAAIMVAEKKCDAIELVVLSLFISIAFSIVAYLLVFIIYVFFLEGDVKYQVLLYSPFAALFLALFLIAQSVKVRFGKFLELSKIKILQSFIGVGFLTFFAYIQPLAVFLILGNIISNTLVGVFSTLTIFFKRIRNIRCKKLVYISRKYINFPKYSTFEAISNIAGLQIPIFIISFLSGDKGGQLFIAMQVLFAPLTLVGQSLSQVYAKRGREHKDKGTLSEFTSSIVTKLLYFGVVPIILIGIFIPTIFNFVFGSDWDGAAYYGVMLIPWIVMQFMASPISSIMYINNQQRRFLNITFLGMLLRVIPTFLFFIFLEKYTVEVFIFTSTLFYSLCFYSFTRTSGIRLIEVNVLFLKAVIILFVAFYFFS